MLTVVACGTLWWRCRHNFLAVTDSDCSILLGDALSCRFTDPRRQQMGIRLERPAGPLTEHRRGYGTELERLGHTRNTVKANLGGGGQLARFLLAEGVPLSAVNEGLLGRFAAACEQENLAGCRSSRMLAPLLAYLRQLGALPPAAPPVPGSPADAVIAGWRQYLLAERGITPASARGYTDLVRPFLATRDDGDRVQLDGTCAAEINAFMLEYAQRFAPKTMQWLASALRSFFGYAFLTGLLDTDLSGAVPGVACRPAQLPKFLTPQQVQAMISTCDPATAAGARDRAMLLMLWRLGLRAGEGARLRPGWSDWRGRGGAAGGTTTGTAGTAPGGRGGRGRPPPPPPPPPPTHKTTVCFFLPAVCS